VYITKHTNHHHHHHYIYATIYRTITIY